MTHILQRAILKWATFSAFSINILISYIFLSQSPANVWAWNRPGERSKAIARAGHNQVSDRDGGLAASARGDVHGALCRHNSPMTRQSDVPHGADPTWSHESRRLHEKGIDRFVYRHSFRCIHGLRPGTPAAAPGHGIGSSGYGNGAGTPCLRGSARLTIDENRMEAIREIDSEP